jgi:glutamate-1-semialdehyde 2,1-aminomutase
MQAVARDKIDALARREEERYVADRPESRALFERAKKSLFRGVPMGWMTEWPGSFPIFVAEARNARLKDLDGHTYVDLALGDSGSLTGHSPLPTAEAICRQVYRGMTTMLPSEDAIWVGEELVRRFGLPYWQIYTTATDADRFAIRFARMATRRNLVVVFDGCYHGSVDEALVTVKDGPRRAQHRQVIGALPNPASRVIQFNDVDALEKALAPGDVACVLAEPAMTNAGIIWPEPGYHNALRAISRKYGTLLILDETHSICAGAGGCAREWGLEPDFFTIGKSIAGGLPAAAMGLTQEMSDRLTTPPVGIAGKHFGIGTGGTVAGTMLQTAAIRATLSDVLTEAAFQKMIAVATRLADGVAGIIDAYELPWHVNRLGCRAEYRFVKGKPRNGEEADRAFDDELDALVHIYMANRGVLLTPFHTMALISPQTTDEDVDLHNRVFGELVAELVA